MVMSLIWLRNDLSQKEMELNGMIVDDPNSSPQLKKKKFSGKINSFFNVVTNSNYSFFIHRYSFIFEYKFNL